VTATTVAPPSSRNAPCPCGSGQRYKDCHGAPASAAMGWVQRALAQMRAHDYAGAEASFRAAAQFAPDDVRIHADIASLCILQRRHDDAEAPLARALALEPEHPYALCLYTHLRQRHCAWDGLAELHERIGRVLDRGVDRRYRFSVFPILSMPTTPRQQQVGAQWAASMFSPPSPLPRPRVTRQAGERLRIGFVTAYFRPHPLVQVMMELWERIDRGRFELFAYGVLPRDAGPVGQRVERAFEHFADVSDEATPRIAQRIRDDRVGILFDLDGYTMQAREGIFALRPAPVQIGALGFLGTMGAPWYDYILTDRFSLPERLMPFYSERPLYMPHMASPSDTSRLPPGPPPARAACGLPSDGFVFCCFNNAYKILPAVFDVWMRLLTAVPGSVLWLSPDHAVAGENLRREASTRGVDPARLIFAPPVSLAEHLARHAHADLFVDTSPYNAGVTANDALLTGLPLITCAGETLASRVAGSQLAAIGLPELITESLADYEALARRLATEPGLLQGYRGRLAANRHTQPLFDMDRYARDFEAALERAWADYAGSAPD
jgi:protein O-GlcNAc transferase